MCSTSVLILVFSVMTALAKAGVQQDQPKQTDPANSPQAAVIRDSGSTNTPGYQVTVHASGSAEWSVSRRRNSLPCSTRTARLPADLTQRFFGDLKSLMPLDKIAGGRCAKSVSFGTTLRVTYQGTTSPDLTCPGNGSQTDSLLKDLSDINTALGVNTSMTDFPQGCEQQPTAPNPR